MSVSVVPYKKISFVHHFVHSAVTPDHAAVIRISHKDHILNPAVLFQLHAAVSCAIADPSVRGIVISTSEPGFVIGADIGFFIRHIEQDRFEPIHVYTELGNECFDLIAQSPKPVVAAINGAAFGGEFELALACHLRIASPDAVVSFPEAGLGICPLWRGILRLKKVLGTELAKSVVCNFLN
jgi:enoyl-CoA hydratase/carnithine racemase